MVQNYFLPVIPAAIRLNDPAAAIEILRVTTKYELGGPGIFNSVYRHVS
jgi:hypothetical protein